MKQTSILAATFALNMLAGAACWAQAQPPAGELLHILHDAVAVHGLHQRQQNVVHRLRQCSVVRTHLLHPFGSRYIDRRYKVYRTPIHLSIPFLKKASIILREKNGPGIKRRSLYKHQAAW